MVYNKKYGPVAIKTKRTMRLSRGFLAFIFIFGLSATLTSEAGRKGRNSFTTTSRERVKRQATGQRPTRQRPKHSKSSMGCSCKMVRSESIGQILYSGFYKG